MPKEGTGVEPGLLTSLSLGPGAFLAGLSWSLCTWLFKAGGWRMPEKEVEQAAIEYTEEFYSYPSIRGLS